MFQSHLAWLDIVERLAAALASGGLIGLDREWLRKPAGLKTHMVFALACGTMATMAVELYLWQREQGTGGSPDLTRVLQGVITGMSFLGAGTIIRGRHRIHGLTTGAGVWLAGALGLVFGVGLYELGAVALGFGLVILVLIRAIEPRENLETRAQAEDDAGLIEDDSAPVTGQATTKD